MAGQEGDEADVAFEHVGPLDAGEVGIGEAGEGVLDGALFEADAQVAGEQLDDVLGFEGRGAGQQGGDEGDFGLAAGRSGEDLEGVGNGGEGQGGGEGGLGRGGEGREGGIAGVAEGDEALAEMGVLCAGDGEDGGEQGGGADISHSLVVLGECLAGEVAGGGR